MAQAHGLGSSGTTTSQKIYMMCSVVETIRYVKLHLQPSFYPALF